MKPRRPRARRPSAAHVVMEGPDIVCTHCGQRHTLIAVPTPIPVFLAAGKAFMRLHERCMPRATGGACPP